MPPPSSAGFSKTTEILVQENSMNSTLRPLPIALMILATLAILTTPLASAQTFIFNRADFATGVGPVAVAVGDFNGDGVTDVVTANSTANTVSVLLGHGDGTFAPHSDYAVEGGPTSIVVGDFNGDG